jgi:hypothetical protein
VTTVDGRFRLPTHLMEAPEMTKVAVSGAVIVFLIFFAVTSPDHAANIVHSAWHALVNVAHGIGDFLNKLA